MLLTMRMVLLSVRPWAEFGLWDTAVRHKKPSPVGWLTGLGGRGVLLTIVALLLRDASLCSA
jgi:hypothetical protein